MAASVRLNALVVGSGWARHAAQVFGSRADVRVAGVVARGSPRSFALARGLGVPFFTALDDAIAETSPAIAVVAVGDTTNLVVATRLLEAGVHVLCAHPVAPAAEEVGALAELAETRGLVASTDYSLRLTDGFRAARRALRELGPHLRAEITYPGRFLPMALDLAVAIGGAVETVSAFGRYPDVLDARRATRPAAFPPTIVLEHAAGSVTALTPSPHAAPPRAMRATTSSEGGRLEIELPCGGTRRLRLKARGSFEETLLVEPVIGAPAEDAFAEAMRALAHAFVDAVVTGSPPPCPLADEVAVRELWNAIPIAMRACAPIRVSCR